MFVLYRLWQYYFLGGFPDWAIAVVSVLSLVALIFCFIGICFTCNTIRLRALGGAVGGGLCAAVGGGLCMELWVVSSVQLVHGGLHALYLHGLLSDLLQQSSLAIVRKCLHWIIQ